jgi:hypothetical protein
MPDKTGKQVSKSAGKPRKEEYRLEVAKLILKTFPMEVIRQRSIDNMNRWKSQGGWSLAYDEWMILMTDGTDADVIEAMTGETDKASRLRSASPYPGLLDQTLVHQLKHEILGVDLAVFDDPRIHEILQKDAEFEAELRKTRMLRDHKK